MGNEILREAFLDPRERERERVRHHDRWIKGKREREGKGAKKREEGKNCGKS